MKKGPKMAGNPIYMGARMSEQMKMALGDPPASATHSIQTQLNPQKVRLPYAVPPIPPEFMPEIGAIAVMWGGIEVAMDQLIEATNKALGGEEEGWRTRNYRKRRALLIDRLHLCLPENPNVTAHYKGILDECSQVMWKRNALLHGHHFGGYRPAQSGGFENIVTAVGFYRGQRLQLTVTFDQIEDFKYELGHLCGLLSEGTHPFPVEQFLQLEQPDRQVLLAFLETNHPTPPTQSTPQHLPE